ANACGRFDQFTTSDADACGSGSLTGGFGYGYHYSYDYDEPIVKRDGVDTATEPPLPVRITKNGFRCIAPEPVQQQDDAKPYTPSRRTRPWLIINLRHRFAVQA
ncbi:hypothetical protein, partial [Caballeronia sp.]|uniref:hypothetical protein n=1 Tax=Caballeronia sp. TaxID=1931223 RepID=UPI003C4A3E69